MKLPDNLKRIRKENNLSQEQLAEKLGVSRQAVSKWESGQSYPEMDKVLTICKLFNYNIDELMNENVKEVSQNKQSKINFNKYVDDFFAYITKTMRMFESMKFGQKLKCIMEQIIVAIVIMIILLIIGAIGSSIIYGLLGWIPSRGYYTLRDVLASLYSVFSFVIGTIVLLHIFKIRYLDYYDIVEQKEDNDLSQNKTDSDVSIQPAKKIIVDNKKEKIIIRDPAHSESRFLNGIAKIVMLGIKGFVGFCALGFIFSLIMLCACFICSFLFVKSGLVFVGALLCIIAAIIINIVILEIAYNFLISKKNAKTRIGISLLASLIAIGIGVGLILVGVTKFNYIEKLKAEDIEKTIFNYEMEEDLSIQTWADVEYIESQNTDIRIEVEHSKTFDAYVRRNSDNTVYVDYTSNNDNFFISMREFIDDINNKQIKDYDYFKIYIYGTKENIQKIKDNYANKQSRTKQYEITINRLNEKIDTLQEELDEKDIQIDKLNDLVDEYRYKEYSNENT